MFTLWLMTLNKNHMKKVNIKATCNLIINFKPVSEFDKNNNWNKKSLKSLLNFSLFVFLYNLWRD